MNKYQRSNEPIAWSLFGAGGMVIALLTPALIIVTAIILPFFSSSDPGHSYEVILGFAQNWLGKLILLAVISLHFFHTAHRLYHGLHDLHIHGPEKAMIAVFYGGAALLSLLTAFWLVML